MFKNREFRTRIVRTEDQPVAPKERRSKEDLLFVNALVNRNVRNAAILIGIGYAGKKLLDTGAHIATVLADTNLK